MNAVRKLVLAVGLVATGVSVALVTMPESVESVPLDSVVTSLGGDYVFVAVFGAVAVLFLLVALAWRAVNGLDQTTPPTPEEVQSVPLFGGDFDDVVDGSVALRDRFHSERRAALRERVREAAIVAEMQAGDCSRPEAERRVANGSWTTDHDAAAFLSDETGPSPSLTARIRATLRGRAWFQRGARSAAREVVRRSEAVSDR